MSLFTRSFAALPVIAFLLSTPIKAQEMMSTESALVSNPAAQVATSSAEVTSLPLPDEGINLTMTPSVLTITTEPGKTFATTIKVHNNRNEDEALQIQILKFSPDPTGAKAVFADLGPGDVFTEWLHFSEKSFIAPSKSWKEIQVTFSPPSYAAPSLYFALAFQRQRDPAAAPGTTTQGLPTILCLTQVSSSRVNHQIDLTSVKPTQRFYEFLPVNFEVGVKNDGNVHELVFGTLFIDWVTGNQPNVGVAEVNTARSYILPQTRRTFTAQWSDGFPLQQDKLTWNFDHLSWFRIGKYKAHVVLAYNDGQHDIPLETDVTFWVFPWRIILGLLALFSILLLGLKGTIQGVLNNLKKLKKNIS